MNLTEEQVVEAIGPLSRFAHDCHAASLALVRSDLLGRECRVARGTLPGIGGQHSWAVVGMNVYRPEWVVDVTAWSYDATYPRVHVVEGPALDHRPHGSGSIWAFGAPQCGNGPTVRLNAPGLSHKARRFLSYIQRSNRRSGIDMDGWANLAHGPMEEWPASEVIGAMLRTRSLAALVPIDIAGMVTDRNPQGLYMREKA